MEDEIAIKLVEMIELHGVEYEMWALGLGPTRTVTLADFAEQYPPTDTKDR